MAPRNRNVAQGFQNIGALLLQMKQKQDEQRQQEFDNTYKQAQIDAIRAKIAGEQAASGDLSLINKGIGTPTFGSPAVQNPMYGPSGKPTGAAVLSGAFNRQEVPRIQGLVNAYERQNMTVPDFIKNLSNPIDRQGFDSGYNPDELYKMYGVEKPPTPTYSDLHPTYAPSEFDKKVARLRAQGLTEEQINNRLINDPDNPRSTKFINPNKRSEDINDYALKNPTVFKGASKAITDFGTLNISVKPEGWSDEDFRNLMKDKLNLDNLFPMSSYQQPESGDTATEEDDPTFNTYEDVQDYVKTHPKEIGLLQDSRVQALPRRK